MRLHNEQVPGFEDVDDLLPQMHLIDGMGDSFEFWARMAQSQGSKPIIFVDGDKIRRVKQQKLQEKIKDIQVIHLDEGLEFEDLVFPETYFQALAQTSGQVIEYSKYLDWKASSGLPKKMMFSKCVDRWLQDTYGFSLEKPETMKRAIELATLDQLHIEKLRELVSAIRSLVS